MVVRLVVITGAPGTGKTTAADEIRAHMRGNWAVIHGDDFIGITQACYGGKKWEEIRRFLPYFAGWSAGWHLFDGKSVVVEGHFRDLEEIDRLYVGVRDMFDRELAREIVRLEEAPETLAKGMAANPNRGRDWAGDDREDNFRKWSELSRLDPAIGGQVIQIGSVDKSRLARTIAAAVNLPWE